MAVYKRTYKAYDGPLTSPVSRFLVLQRYAFKSVFKSKSLFLGYVLCFIPPLIVLCTLYLNQNASLLALVGQKTGFMKINGSFFMNVLGFQGVLAGLLTAFVATNQLLYVAVGECPASIMLQRVFGVQREVVS